MPDASSYAAALERTSPVAYARKCFRVVELQTYQAAKNPELLFDLGPKQYGQRFSPPGDHRGLYVSAGLQTAGAEFAGNLPAWLVGSCSKHVTFDMEVKLSAVLDLTSASIRRALKITKADVQSVWEGFIALNDVWPVTWMLGHDAFASKRFDGILYPSTKNRSGTCVLVFTERLIPGKSHVMIHKQDGSVWERLP